MRLSKQGLKFWYSFLAVAGILFFLFTFATKSVVAYAAEASINATEITIYGLDSDYEEYISIPTEYRQSFQLIVSNSKSVTYSVTKGNSVTVTEDGLIEPKYTTWYWQGNMGSTDPSWADSATRVEKSAEYGTSEITVITDDGNFVVKVHLVNYAITYANKVMDDYIAENIDPSMTDYEKLEAICKFIASYDYSAYHSSCVGMIVSNEGGDCWASTDTAVQMCKKLGYEAWGRNGNKDPGAGSGHRNAIVSIGDTYYILEAGYSEEAPRYYSIDTKKTLFSYYNNGDGLTVYQYDAKENVTGTFIIPEAIEGKKVTKIDTYFSKGSGLSEVTKIVLPDTVKTIGEDAFYDCKKMTSINLPPSLETLEGYAFASCVSLKNITIPSKLTALGEDPFFNCTSLMDIYVYESNPNFKGVDGVLYNKAGNRLISYPRGREGKVVVPSTVTEIEVGAFAYCNKLKNVILSDKISKLPMYTFYYCSSLETVVIGNEVTEIEAGAFYECNSLKNVYFKCTKQQWESIAIGEYNTCLTAATVHYDFVDVYEKAPAKPYKAANVVSGVHVYWNSVSDVQKYGLWRSETGENGTYKWIANPTTNHFTDKNVVSGKKYYYKVTVMNPFTDTHSNKSEAIGITYVATPDITARFNKAAGISIGWNKVEGATGYAIYRKTYGGTDAWKRVATVSGNKTLSWMDSLVRNNNGFVYKYTVRALAESDMKTLSGCRSEGRTMVRLTSRDLSLAQKASGTAVKCKWSTTLEATGYEVRFMEGTKVYKTFTIGNYKTGIKTFTGLAKGKTYKIQVRSYKKVSGVGTFYSAWSEAKNVTL